MSVKRAHISLYPHNNVFNVDRIFIKLADKLESNRFSDEFESLPNLIIHVRVTCLFVRENIMCNFIPSHPLLYSKTWVNRG